MGKRNLLILLLMPFAIALATLTTVNATFNLIEQDIVGIAFDYKANDAFRLSDEPIQLKAIAQNQLDYPVYGEKLKWSVRNKNSAETEPHARIEDDDKLITLSEGEIVLTVSNSKGNVFKSFSATIYLNGALTINPKAEESGTNIDPNVYYGQYDLDDSGNKRAASIALEVSAQGEMGNVRLESHSQNISVNADGSLVTIDSVDSERQICEVVYSYEEASLTKQTAFRFTVVKDAVNVYSYDDLMECTNRSMEGEKVCLRVNLESQANQGEANTVLFGKKKADGSWTFKDDVYRFPTKYNRSYIDQWNNFVKHRAEYSKVSDEVLAGIRVQKDFYGNGYSINLHDLTYPYEYSEQGGQRIPMLRDDNLFRGALPYYCLGDPNGLPLVTAFGQDNVGMYVEGDGITVNDLSIRNCDFGNNLSNLDYVGTVMELNGEGITLTNSRLSNGKNVLKAYSSEVSIDNCMLSYSRNFLLMAGAYEYLPVDGAQSIKVKRDTDGAILNTTIDEFIGKSSTNSKKVGDQFLCDFIQGLSGSHTKETLEGIQDGLDYAGKGLEGLYKGHVEVNDTYFYKSGIASIALESSFNGPYLYSAAPSLIGELFSRFSLEGKAIVPLEATKAGGISYPVEVTIKGDTRFYDYKDTSLLDISGLIQENISAIASSLLGSEKSVTIDDIFPMKPVLISKAASLGYVNDSKICIPVAHYGGGLNFSRVVYDQTWVNASHMGGNVEADLIDRLLEDGPASISSMTGMRSVMRKCVTVVTGFSPFSFDLANGDGYLKDEAPQWSDLIRQ